MANYGVTNTVYTTKKLISFYSYNYAQLNGCGFYDNGGL